MLYMWNFSYTCRTFDMLNIQVTFDLYYMIVFEGPCGLKESTGISTVFKKSLTENSCRYQFI